MKTTSRKPRASKMRGIQRSQKRSSPEVLIKRVATFDATGLTPSQTAEIFRRLKFY